MKKKTAFFNLILALFISGCTNTDVNNMMTSISNSIETGINNVSSFVNKLAASKPLHIFPAVPQSKYFEMDSYKLEMKYTDGLGIEVRSTGLLYNKTNSTLEVVIDFPIYDLYGNIVDRGIITCPFYRNGSSTLVGSYYQYRLEKDLRVVQEQVRTRVYMNGNLIASAGRVNKPVSSAVKQTSGTKAKQQTVSTAKKQEVKKPVQEETNPASPKPRQVRQNLKK